MGKNIYTFLVCVVVGYYGAWLGAVFCVVITSLSKSPSQLENFDLVLSSLAGELEPFLWGK